MSNDRRSARLRHTHTTEDITFPLLAPNGSVSAPSYSFALDTNTGILSGGADLFQVATAGALAMEINGSQRVAFGRQVGSLGFRVTAAGASSAGSFLSEDTAVADGSRPFSFWRANGGNTEFGNSNRSGTGTTSSAVRMVITGNGEVVVNHTAALAGHISAGAFTPRLQLHDTGTTASQIIARWSNNNDAPIFQFGKSRSGTIGTFTVVSSGDELGRISWAGADGTDFAEGARIAAFVDGTPGAGDMPTKLSFFTAADGSESPTERLTIGADGMLTVGFAIKFTGVISPTQLTANTNDWAPTNLANAVRIRATTDASRDLTGLTGGADGRWIILLNVGSNPLVLKHESASSSAANRFSLASATDTTLQAGGVAHLEYDGTSSRWRQVNRVA